MYLTIIKKENDDWEIARDMCDDLSLHLDIKKQFLNCIGIEDIKILEVNEI